MGGLVTKMAQSMGFCPNLPKNPYFEPFLWLNHPFLGLATFRKVDSLMKMSNFSFINFSQKLGAQDLRNSVGPLREPTLLNKVLCTSPKKVIEKYWTRIWRKRSLCSMPSFDFQKGNRTLLICMLCFIILQPKVSKKSKHLNDAGLDNCSGRLK